MNSTNRVLNRLFLLVIGLVVLIAGATAVAVTTVPAWSHLWKRSAPGWQSTLEHAQQLGLASIGVPRPVPWFLAATPVIALVVIVLLLIFVFAQGWGRLGRVVDGWHVADGETDAFLTVDVEVARDAIRQAARGIRGISEPAVTAYRVKGEPALKVTVSITDGIDAATLVEPLESALREWDGLLGEEVPVYLQLTPAIGEGVRAPLRALTAGRRELSLVE
ncbi:hypothetical protein GCM10022288_20950 [Gryllotalpicola kribbensis]|jgi:hypothetical protein|uniref:Alkaline shock response membrane anchor protein AmaP n=1 Tax=Gryllotalpicola kribbensis TaxID=993084 RepID=A0ABP8AUL9_9MICO